MANPTLRYQIVYTTADKTPISVPRSSIVGGAGDIVFIGKNRLEYGEVFNTNTVHLLEHFACPENPATPDTPDLNSVISPLLQRPTVGQIWFNKTKSIPMVWNGTAWAGLAERNTVAGNSGVLLHGNAIPRPVNTDDGYTYSYEECSWVVSPFGFTEPDRITFLSCYTDANANITMQYKRAGSPTLFNGYANYQIVGIRNTTNHGVPPSTPNIPGLTPTPTVTPTFTPSRTPAVTASITPTVSRTPAYTRTATPTPTTSATETPFPSVTRTNTPTPTPTPTITPTVSPSFPAPIYVDIFDQEAIRTGPLGGNFVLGYRSTSSGLIIVYDSNGMSVPSQWVIGDDPTLYSIRITIQDGNITPSGFADDWLNGATTRTWEIATDPSTPAGSYYTVFLVEIKRNADEHIMDYCTVRLQINVQ